MFSGFLSTVFVISFNDLAIFSNNSTICSRKPLENIETYSVGENNSESINECLVDPKRDWKKNISKKNSENKHSFHQLTRTSMD